ncbi:T9SS type A sorting domain-containing protein [Flavobacterium enshiense]|uniref:T9SS type A sorting domain-containing protein n=1 Tax=Flavobacterium enshiense TaxID=1341165 RepID=UPI00345DD9BF
MIKNYFLLLSLLLVSGISNGQWLAADIFQTSQGCYGECNSFEVNYPTIKETTSYTVSSITYNPPFGATSGTATQLNLDDRWSDVIDLKGISAQDFNFCFYGQNYSKVLVSTNGVITFSIAGVTTGGLYTPNSFSTWVNSGAVPYAGPSANAPFKNSINGVFQDLNPAVSNAFATPNINYYTAGAFPNRVFVLNLANSAQYGCSSDAAVGAQTSQILLYEGSNIIEVHVQRRVPCTTWANGNGLIGIQNEAGSQGVTPSGRNGGTWSATNEAWRFTPAGNDVVPTITWLKSGNVIGSGAILNTCDTNQEIYTAQVSFANCSSTTVLSDTYTFTPIPEINAGQPNVLTLCSSAPQPYTFDLTQNTPVVLNGLDPQLHAISYHASLNDAQNGTGVITNPQNFVSTGQTIYVKIEDLITACYTVKSFDLAIVSGPSAPTGNPVQTFSNGETLANVEVTGDNIQWYSDAQGGTLLSSSTLLVNGTTYYASQTDLNGCESRNTTSNRFAVTVYDVLSNNEWNNNLFSVYPNPVKDMLNISYASEITSVEIFNMIGQRVALKSIGSTHGEMNISNLTAGTYIVKVTSEGLTKSIKIVKE